MFSVKKPEKISKTFRIDKDLIDRMEVICTKEDVSMNQLVIMCIEYSLDNMEEKEKWVLKSKIVFFVIVFKFSY